MDNKKVSLKLIKIAKDLIAGSVEQFKRDLKSLGFRQEDENKVS